MSAAASDIMQVPEVAIQWIAWFGVNSNVELANLSNVCCRWRAVVKQVVLKQAMEPHSMESNSGLPLLLLPSMIRRLTCLQDERMTSDSSNETFCAAWFHPDGIEEKRVALTEEADDMEENGSIESHTQHTQASLSEPFAPSGGQTYETSDTERKGKVQRRRRPRSKSPANGGIRRPNDVWISSAIPVNCSDEWRGFQLPIQVLGHFGFTSSFVRDVLQAATESMDTDDTTTTLADDLLRQAPLHQPTFAVRGATVARPEGYCLCMDLEKENMEELKNEMGANLESTRIRIQEYKESLARRNRQLKVLQREVLPRVLTRDVLGDSGEGSQHRSIQFLNADASHAVCMLTPPFDCGPLSEPVTILCVGIATEDGCFLSGLKHRFELGHLYPADSMAEVTEMSPVCIATENWKEALDKESANGSSAPFNISGSDDSSYDFSDEEDSSTPECDCLFQQGGNIIDELHEGNDFQRTYRGRIGPGQWHCYVAVFDGDDSVVRIDGLTDPLQSNDDSMREDHTAMLDGLTIGSDHCFGMSLCCGHGSGGEGEGAIAELAVFRGRLDLADIQALERQVMQRHGIPPIDDAFEDCVWQESTWKRQAQALFWQANEQDWKLEKGVPLRVMARHRSVAWRQQSPVTGKQVRIPKIGSRPGASSSDW